MKLGIFFMKQAIYDITQNIIVIIFFIVFNTKISLQLYFSAKVLFFFYITKFLSIFFIFYQSRSPNPSYMH